MHSFFMSLPCDLEAPGAEMVLKSPWARAAVNMSMNDNTAKNLVFILTF